MPPLLLPPREPMTPFSGGVGVGLERSSAAAGKAAASMERMESGLDRLDETFVYAFEQQAGRLIACRRGSTKSKSRLVG